MVSLGGFDFFGGGRGLFLFNVNEIVRFNLIMVVVIIVFIGGCFIFGFILVFICKCMMDGNVVIFVERLCILSMKICGFDKVVVDVLLIVYFKDLDEKNDWECLVCLIDFEFEDNLCLLFVCKYIFY